MSTIPEPVRKYLNLDPASPATDHAVNVSETERLVTAAAGALLVKYGIHRRGLTGVAALGVGAAMLHRGYTGHCALYKKYGVTGNKAASSKSYFEHGIHVKGAVTVSKSPDELYAYWRKFDHLPTFMDHLISVTVVDEKTSKWVAKGPLGTEVKWDAEVINDVPGELIAWRSLAGAQVDNAGSVRFVPGTEGRGTEVRVSLEYIPPGRTLGKWVARLFGEEPQQQVHQELRKFKQLMETGVISTIDGQSKGTKLTPTKPLEGSSQSPLH